LHYDSDYSGQLPVVSYQFTAAIDFGALNPQKAAVLHRIPAAKIDRQTNGQKIGA
jgi:hypothetical protein